MVELAQTHNQADPDDREEDYWLVCLREIAGCPAILRLIAGVPEDIDAEDYQDRVAIVWHYEAEDDGLPQDRDSARMDFFEDVLSETVEDGMNACLAIVETVKGAKQWTVYSDDGAAVASVVSKLARLNALPIEVRHDKEPDWASYHRLMAAAEETE